MVELLAFTAEQVRGLTGLSNTQLRYWDRTEFFHPQHAAGYRAFGRVYSFRDVVGLRAIAILRKTHGVSLQELRQVGAELAQRAATPWASLKLYVLAKKVYFADPETGTVMAVRPKGQTAILLALDEIARDVGAAADTLRHRSATHVGRIVRNRYVLHNVPVISGTRVPTEAVWSLHEAGYDVAAIIGEYPRLTAEDVHEAIKFELDRRAQRAS